MDLHSLQFGQDSQVIFKSGQMGKGNLEWLWLDWDFHTVTIKNLSENIIKVAIKQNMKFRKIQYIKMQDFWFQ